MLRQLGLANGMRLVDLGCGSGRLAAALHGTANISYLGIDIIQALLATPQPKLQAMNSCATGSSAFLSTPHRRIWCALSAFSHIFCTQNHTSTCKSVFAS